MRLPPGPQRADGSSQRGEAATPPEVVVTLVEIGKVKRGATVDAAHQPLGERVVSGPLQDSPALI